MTNPFHFKQFTVHQTQSAFKVGVDGVLLGAWVNIGSAQRILDVGTGTGVIGLMLAQRSEAEVQAVELSESAFEEAKSNCAASPWANRVSIVQDSFQNLSALTVKPFDLIVSNPPYFSAGTLSGSSEKDMARHATSLPHVDLLEGAQKLGILTSRLAVILPKDEAYNLLDISPRSGWFLNRLTKVYPSPEKTDKRWLMELSKTISVPEKSELIIQSKPGEFTEEYKELTKDFYLKF